MHSLLERGVKHNELIDAIVPRQGFADEEDEIRVAAADKLRQRAHERLVLLHPSRRVNEHYILPFRNCVLHRKTRDIRCRPCRTLIDFIYLLEYQIKDLQIYFSFSNLATKRKIETGDTSQKCLIKYIF